jgi:hypothetical protein
MRGEVGRLPQTSHMKECTSALEDSLIMITSTVRVSQDCRSMYKVLMVVMLLLILVLTT